VLTVSAGTPADGALGIEAVANVCRALNLARPFSDSRRHKFIDLKQSLAGEQREQAGVDQRRRSSSVAKRRMASNGDTTRSAARVPEPNRAAEVGVSPRIQILA